jgi:hypothetical protein
MFSLLVSHLVACAGALEQYLLFIWTSEATLALCGLDCDFHGLAQAHELSAGCLGALAAATQLTSLSLEGIPRMGAEGWAAVAALTRLSRLAVRSRGDNAGLGQVRAHARMRGSADDACHCSNVDLPR